MEQETGNNAVSGEVLSEEPPVHLDDGVVDSNGGGGAALESSSPMTEDWTESQDRSEHAPSADDNHGLDTSESSQEYVVDHSTLIREASEAAVAEAVAMKRSDSDLSEDQLNDMFEEEGEESQSGGHGRSMSIAYLEHASFEAEMMSNTHHRLQPSGRLGRLRNSASKEVIDVVDSMSDSISIVDDIFDKDDIDGSSTNNNSPHERRASQRHFQSMSKTSLPTIPATETLTIDDSGHSEDDDRPHQSLSHMETFELSNLAEELAIDTAVVASDTNSFSKLSEEASFLHGLFAGFCRPSVPATALEEIIELELGNRLLETDDHAPIQLPVGAVIARPSTGLMKLLNNHHSSFLRLPRVIALSVCRILTRILTGATDREYNFCIMRYCPWQDDVKSLAPGSENDSSNETVALHRLYPGSDEATRADMMYSVVRLRMQWPNALKQVLDLLESILQFNSRSSLIAPVTLLLGVLCAGGVKPKELRRMVDLASMEKMEYHWLRSQLMMVRALGIAAMSTARPSALVGSNNPLHLFSFLPGLGIIRTISLEKSSWPFRNDFCTAFSFRAEDFVAESVSVVLFAAMGENGNGIEISLNSLPKEGNNHASAGMLRISVMESFEPVETFQVTRCPLHARVWYHVAVRHTRSRLKGVFSLSAKEQMTIMVDGKIMLSESVRFPQIHEDYSSKSLSFTYGKNFDGQTGTLYVFHENVSDSILKSVASFTANRSNGRSRHPSRQLELKSRHKELITRVRGLSKLGKDDLRSIAFCHRSMHDADSPTTPNGDASEDVSTTLAKGLYLVWEPQQTTGGGYIIDTHSGAHVSLVGSDQAQFWNVEGAQQVISSIGGVQLLVLIVQSLLRPSGFQPDIDISLIDNAKMSEELVCFSLIPDILYLISAFVCTHPQNSREILRCGAIEILEGLVFKCSKQTTSSKLTFYSALVIFPSLAALFVSRLEELRCKSREFLALETAVISRLLFNMPLWFGGLPKGDGVALVKLFLPLLSKSLTEQPDICDFVSVSDVVVLLVDLAAMQREKRSEGCRMFWRDRNSLRSMITGLTVEERHHITDTLLYWTLLTFHAEVGVEDLTAFLSVISKNLDLQFEETSKMIAEGRDDFADVEFVATQRNLLTVKMCEVLLLAFRTSPISPKLFETFATACGGIQQGAAWILSAMINCHSDQIRGIGIQCLVIFVRAASSHLNQLFDIPQQQADPNQRTTFQENTMMLMNSVGNGILSSNVGKGIAAMASQGVRSKLVSPTKLSPRVIYKLLWHLVKSHRYRMKQFTQAGLIFMVFEGIESFKVSLQADKSLSSQKMDFEQAELLIANTTITRNSTIADDGLGVSTLFRLLRFLPNEYLNKWLADLVELSKNSFDARTALSSCRDWQACLFQLVSESVEKSANTTGSNEKGDSPGEVVTSDAAQIFNHCLELYGLLLGRLVRTGGDKSIAALEDCAALQRVFVNGPEAFALVLSHLLQNIFENGITLGSFQPQSKSMECETMEPIKQTAQKITNEILSNGSPSAVASWRVLRYLTTAVVAFVTTTSTLSNVSGFWNDTLSGGLCGILLPENGVTSFHAEDVARISRKSESPDAPLDVCLRIRLNVVEQLFTILDIFIFPATVSSQLHGLALVRSAETRGGNAQGPLLASLIRASLFLLSHLDPSSIQVLQCCSRLLCLCHYSLELLRESQALEGYTSGFANVTAPLDHVLMAVVVHVHSMLQKCALVLHSIESETLDSVFPDKDSRKKRHRRLFKVCLELREILATLSERRSALLQDLMTREAYTAFRSIMESKTETSQLVDTRTSSDKEWMVRSLLASEWISKFETSRITSGSQDESSAPLRLQKSLFMASIARDSTGIEAAFQKSLNSSFEDYLEQQRTWAESSAVRDLEFEGDTRMKNFANKCDQLRSSITESDIDKAVQLRVQLVNHVVGNILQPSSHWMMDRHEDPLGRRILLVPNQAFKDYHLASYDLMMGSDQQQPSKTESLSRNAFSDIVRRNSSAFVPEEQLEEDLDLDDLEDEDFENQRDDNGTDFDKSSEKKLMTESASSTTRSDGGTSDEADQTKEVISEVHTKEPVGKVDESQRDAWARTFIWADTECILGRFDGITSVTLQHVFKGEILLSTHCIYFGIHEGVDVFSREAVSVPKDMQFSQYRLEKLTEAHGRRYLLKTQALELFFVDRNELFLSFASHKERNRFYAKIRNSCKTPLLSPATSLNPRLVFKRSRLTSLWKRRQISNFDYLMALNRMAGRTFNDISQYPVFPWILADYHSEKIDLSDSRVYRDLSKPIGALNPERLALLLERYNELESFGFSPEEKFLYGSHYSSPGMVVHFNIRQEPFTTMAVSLQGGRFDCPDRLFFDLGESWKSCNTSTSDVKELIPELFTMPEVLLNENKLPLGKTQRGVVVNDVGLPPWAKGSAHEFVRIHRLALESEYASRNLHSWIDLIFGCKQRGPEAEAAHNVFHHLSYEGSVDIDKIADEVDRQAAESHIQNFGQTPSQLTNANHPTRLVPEDCWQPLINNMSNAVRLRCHTPAQSHQFGKKGTYTSGFVASIFVGGDGLIAMYSDLKVGFFRLSPKSPSNRLNPERLKILQNRESSRSNSILKRGSTVLSNDETVGNWSFAVTHGGKEVASKKRKALSSSRLASAKEVLYTESPPMIVSCGYWDNSLKVHSTDDGSQSESRQGHLGEITCLSIGSADGEFLVTGGDDCTCRIWTVAYPDMAAALSDGYTQTALDQKTSGDQILSCLHTLLGHESPISCVDLSTELDVVASGSIDGLVCIHKLRSGEFVRSFRLSNRSHVTIRKVALERHGRMVVHTSDLRLYTFTVNGARLSFANVGERIHDMKITGEVVITGGEKSHVYIRNLSTLKVLSGLDLSRHGPIRCLAMTPENLNPLPQHLFIGSDDGMISIVEHD